MFIIYILACLAALIVVFAVREQKKAERNYNRLYTQDFEATCDEFLKGIKKAADLKDLSKLKQQIDYCFCERPFIPSEYSIKDKVYKTYYDRYKAIVNSL